MATIYNQVLIHWVDKNGKPGTSFWTTLDQANTVPAGLIALGGAAAAISDAGLVAVQYQVTAVVGAAGGTGDYPTIYDRAVMLANIQDTGAPCRFEIPAPKSSIFLSDTVTVDFSNPLVTAFVAQVQANTGDRSGNPTGAFKRGRRSEARGGP